MIAAWLVQFKSQLYRSGQNNVKSQRFLTHVGVNKPTTIELTERGPLSSHLVLREVGAKTVLLQEGEVSKTMFFIKTGCLRTYVNYDGKDITTQFFFEGDTVSSIESFRTNQPSLYSIESLEPCVLLTISQKDFQKVVDNSPALRKSFEERLFARLFQTQQLAFSYLKNNPEKRYQELIQQYPHIVQRVPQHYIASYLGITAVSLSRIRNRR